MNAVMKLQVSWKIDNFLTSWIDLLKKGSVPWYLLVTFRYSLLHLLNLSYTEILFPWHTNLSEVGESIVLWSLSRAIYKQRVSPVNEYYMILKYFLAAVKEVIDLHQFKFTVLIAEETCIKTKLVRLAVLTTPILGIHIFWDVKTCQLVNSHQCFRGT